LRLHLPKLADFSTPYSLLGLDEGAGAELAAGVDEELSELDLLPPSAEELDEESLLPSLLLEEVSEEAFGAAEDFDG
jgi:hypothetical protein